MTTESSGAHARVREPDLVPETSRPPARREEVAVSVGDQRRDPIRWGAVWSGLIVTLAVFILLEIGFFALGWLTFAQGNPGTTAGLVSALIVLVAFFVGGFVAGGTSIWRGAREGVMHGTMVWALGIVAIIFLTLFGGGALFGSLATALSQASSLQEAVNVPEAQLDQAVDSARGSAGWAVLGLVLSLLAAAVGGLLGVKTGSRKDKDSETSTVDVR